MPSESGTSTHGVQRTIPAGDSYTAKLANDSPKTNFESKKNATDEENSNGGSAAYLDAYDSSDEAKAARVEQISAQLGTPIKVVSDPEEIGTLPSRRKRLAKGWYDEANDEVVVMLPNNVNVADVENTVVHEVVGHKGLRKLIGEERFTHEFLKAQSDRLNALIRQEEEQSRKRRKKP